MEIQVLGQLVEGIYQLFLVGVLNLQQDVPPQACGRQCAGVLCLCSIRGLVGVRTSVSSTAFAVVGLPSLSSSKRDPEYSCRQLISEQEASCSIRLGEFNKYFFTGKQSKLLFKLLPGITLLVLNSL